MFSQHRVFYTFTTVPLTNQHEITSKQELGHNVKKKMLKMKARGQIVQRSVMPETAINTVVTKCLGSKIYADFLMMNIIIKKIPLDIKQIKETFNRSLFFLNFQVL